MFFGNSLGQEHNLVAPELTSAVSTVAASAVLVRLHFLPTGLSPIKDAVSDYGTTRFHPYYRAMVVLLGAGSALFAIGLAQDTDARGLAWLWIFAASRVAIAGFMTDADPPPFTREGRVHWLLAATAFTSIAFAASGVSWTGDPEILGPLGAFVAVTAIGTLVTRLVPSFRAFFGLVERLLYIAMIAWLIVGAADLIGG
jgi:hypothetical protein